MEDGFAIVGIHLKVLVGESASDALDWNKSKIELRVLVCNCVAQSSKKLCAPDGSAGASEKVPVGFCDVDTGWALVTWGAFDSVRVSASRQMAVGEFNNKDLGAAL